MKRIIAILACLTAIAAAEAPVKLTTTHTGVNGESLSGAPYTDAIDMWDATMSNQITMTWVVTPGTTTVVTMGCSQATVDTATAYAPIPLCDTASPSICVQDVRSMTLSSFTISGSTYALTADWPITERFVKCYASGTGTGTVVATGTRSWQ